MNNLLKYLGMYKNVLIRQEMQTIRGQVLAGQREAALKGLERCLTRHHGFGAFPERKNAAIGDVTDRL